MLKSRKTYALIIVLMLSLVVAAGCGGGEAPSNDESANGANADKAINIKIGHVLAPTHPYQTGLEEFAKLVEEKTEGQVTVDVFHSSQLGNEREMIEALQMGTLDMALVSTAPLAGFSNEFLVFDLPFIFDNRDNAYKVLDGEIGSGILSTLESKGIKGLGYWENGFRNVTNSQRPVIHPEDMQGLKIRTMENKIHMASFRTIGADPTAMAFGELFTALQQQTVDAQENPLPIIFTSNFFEVQDNLAMTGHFYAAAPMLISKQLWDGFSPEIQNAIQEAATEARDFERETVASMDSELLGTLKDKGMQVTEVDKAEWREAMQPVYEEFEKEIGADVIQKVLDAQK
ncbi:TRAP transporter substrate-binding protein [Metallumcola ferriviriculae]|uniref:TRAP transporter substrate-binding protein n=1 Tax=Metallumcola ferriviriculae TaxID=3039180 RepID=A0AAU0UJT5_9FIRM|nr:TRAP transporter substrate-binding protein [Desulfitibacteraceae bacterium MK1]